MHIWNKMAKSSISTLDSQVPSVYPATKKREEEPPPYLNSAPADRSDSLPHEVHVHLRRVLLQLAEDLGDVSL